jgi:hypothetical protein
VDFFQQVWYQERMIDTTWSMALGTAEPDVDSHLCDIRGFPQVNVLLRWLGIRAVPHLPCRFNCQASVKLADNFLALGREFGYSAEIDWLFEMLSWPVEWSALHGIAEIRTPILKITTCTDATSSKYIVRYRGSSYPEEGAQGLNFPYPITRIATEL